MNSSPFPIVARIQAARDCTQVTAARLAKLKGELRLDDKGISSLKAGDFPGLSKLTEIWLGTNQLSALPAGVFDGLSALEELNLETNRLSALPGEVLEGLSSLTELTLMANQLSSLPEDVFDGLSSLYWISLPSNRLTTLPDGVFEGLSALGILEVQDNSVDPMVLAVSLERVGNNGFKATVPAGAPFTMTLPVSVTNGSIDSGATTLRIPVGAVESGTVTATRTTGTTASGTDFTAESGTLTFAANETSKTVSVSTTDDSLDEENETFTLTLSNPANATLGDATATGTIVDDDESPPLTASFEDMPASHDGENAFTFGLTFSEHFPISYKTLRDHAFDVTGGAVRKAARKQQGSKLRWTITVQPDSSASVQIELPETTDCDANGAICTGDGRPLSHSLSATVNGPAASRRRGMRAWGTMEPGGSAPLRALEKR